MTTLKININGKNFRRYSNNNIEVNKELNEYLLLSYKDWFDIFNKEVMSGEIEIIICTKGKKSGGEFRRAWDE